MRTTLATGQVAEIEDDGNVLRVSETNGDELFTVHPPEHSKFYQFIEHVVEGECPVVSFEPGHEVNGWMDWYYKVNITTHQIEKLNPWR